MEASRPVVLWRVRILVSAVFVLILVALSLGLHASQSNSRKQLADRFAAKGTVTAAFITSYVDELLQRESRVAAATLTGAHPDAAFAAEVRAFGFQSAMLLDGRGRALALFPTDTALIGRQLATRYPHLAPALEGQSAVSGIVVSAVRHQRVVTFAVPIAFAGGHRVFSGGYTADQTALSAFLSDSVTIPEARLYIVDRASRVIASNQSVAGAQPLDPTLDLATRAHDRGDVELAGQSYYFVRRAVTTTPWQVVLTVPSSRLFAAVAGTAAVVPWLILGGLAIAAAVAVWLWLRLIAGRQQLARANDRLDRLSRVDELTGLANRRHINEQLAMTIAAASRHNHPLSFLVMDIDHFKRINDRHGHSAGDEVLREVARRFTNVLRADDLVGRWGGEEFVALLPHSDTEAARRVAERLRETTAATPILVGEHDETVTVTVSVGVATWAGEDTDVLINRADAALYQAKRAGRDVIIVDRIRSKAKAKASNGAR